MFTQRHSRRHTLAPTVRRPVQSPDVAWRRHYCVCPSVRLSPSIYHSSTSTVRPHQLRQLVVMLQAETIASSSSSSSKSPTSGVAIRTYVPSRHVTSRRYIQHSVPIRTWPQATRETRPPPPPPPPLSPIFHSVILTSWEIDWKSVPEITYFCVQLNLNYSVY